jgi:hypothetical protein
MLKCEWPVALFMQLAPGQNCALRKFKNVLRLLDFLPGAVPNGTDFLRTAGDECRRSLRDHTAIASITSAYRFLTWTTIQKLPR